MFRWWAEHPWRCFWCIPFVWILTQVVGVRIVGETFAGRARLAAGTALSATLAILWAASYIQGLRFTWRKRKAVALSVFALSLPAFPSIAFVLMAGAFIGPADLVVSDSAQAVRDAHAIIEEQRRDRTRLNQWLYAQDLPASLRVPGLRYVAVHTDHVDLVLGRNPDGEVGGRIWADAHRPHADKATRYAGIYFFDYTNDLPESPQNID